MSILTRLHQSLFGSLQEKEEELRQQESALQAELHVIETRRAELQEELREEGGRLDQATIESARALNHEALQAARRERERLDRLAVQKRAKLVEETRARLESMLAEQKGRLEHIQTKGREMAQLELQGRELWADIVQTEEQSAKAADAMQKALEDLRVLGVAARDLPAVDNPPDSLQAIVAAMPVVLDALRAGPRLGSHSQGVAGNRFESVMGHFCALVMRWGAWEARRA